MTSDNFGASAARLCGAASLLLGWRPKEFWESTPAELAAALSGPGESDQAPADRTILDALRQRFPDQ